jgi:hypothetical protein
MSYRYIESQANALQAVLQRTLEVSEPEAIQIMDALLDYVRAVAQDEVERKFNEGDYRG